MPEYFETMGIPLLAGRSFDERDFRPGTPPSAIVNESLAQQLWKGTDAVGKRFRSPEGGPWTTVVGVVGDVRDYGLDRPVRTGIYVPFPQRNRDAMTIVLRTTANPSSVVEPARRQLRELDPEISIFDVQTMRQRLDESLWLRRSYSLLFAAFAGAALLLAVGGVYGIISFAMSRRTDEIGLRMALGARRIQVLRQTLLRGLSWIGIGLAMGVSGAVPASRALGSMLFGVGSANAVIYLAAFGIVALVSGVSVLIPALRAANIDPAVALRQE
jgi:putative ABC transport system permease protein